MNPGEILARFDAEMRIDPPPEPGVRYDRAGSVVRGCGRWHAVVFARPAAGTADAVIADQLAFFRSIGVEASSDDAGADGANVTAASPTLEWKVYGHDRPPDLETRLAAAGFEPDESETLMVFDLAGALPAGPAGPEAADVRRVTDAAGLDDLIAAGSAAFGRSAATQMARIGADLHARLTDPTWTLYVAYADGRPVAGARLQLPEGRSFAGLWGGGTVPDYRRRGIYRALVQVRAEEARWRGYRYLRVEARETSRPILERLGFIALTRVTEWKRRLA